MCRLIGYELKKLFTGKWFLLFLVLLLGLNWYLAARSVPEIRIREEQEMSAFIEEYKKDPEAMEAYIADYFALLRAYDPTNPESRRPENIYSDSDRVLFSNFAAIRDFTATHAETVKKARKIAQSRISEYAYLGYPENRFEVVYQKSVLRSYEGLSELEFPLENVVGYDLFFQYDGFCAPLLAAIMLCGILLIAPETNGGMLLLLRSTRRGRTQTFSAKIVVAFFVSILLCVLFTGVSLLTFSQKIGLYGLNLPIQMVSSMALSPFQISIGEGILLALLWRIFAAFTFCMIVVLAACLFRRYLAVYASVIAIAGINYAMATYSFLNDYSALRNINFFWSLNGIRTVEIWRGIKLFGKCVSLSVALVVIYFLLIAVCFFCGCAAFNRQSIRGRSWKGFHIKLPFSLSIKWPKRKYSLSLYRYELRKILSLFSLIVAVAFFLLLIHQSDSAFHLQRDYHQNLYTSYMEELDGEWTEEKHHYLQNTFEEMMDILSQKESMKLKYQAGLLPLPEYTRYLSKATTAEIQRPVIEALWQHSQYLKEQHDAGHAVAFFDETGWQQLRLTNLAWIACAAIIFLCSDLFSCEYRSGFQKIQSVTQRGRNRTAISKCGVALTVALLFSLLTELCQFLFVLHFSGLPGASYPAVSIEAFSGAGNYSLGMYFLLSVLKNVFLAEILALACVGISRLTKRLIPTLLLMTALVFAPVVFSYFGISLFDKISYLNLFGR